MAKKPKNLLDKSKSVADNKVAKSVGTASSSPTAPKGAVAAINHHANTYALIMRLMIWWIPAAIIVVLGCFVAFTRADSVYSFTLDDSFITYRYAKNLINGHGLVWNIGEHPPVEGYTTFLWVLVNAVFELFSLDPVQGSKVLSYLSLILIALLIPITPFGMKALMTASKNKIGDALPQSSFIQSKASTLSWFNPLTLSETWAVGLFMSMALFIFPSTAAHMVSGMETLFAGLLLLMFVMNLAYFDLLKGKKAYIVPAVLGLACGLIRPEFNVGVFLGLVSLLLLNRHHKERYINIGHALIIYVLCGLAYFMARYYYYGLAFPLPFYIKQLEPTGELLKGWPNVRDFFYRLWPFFLLAAIGVLTNIRRLLPAFVAVVAILAYFTLPEHIMSIYHRFVYPTFPIVLWLGAAALHAAVTLKVVPHVVWPLTGLFITVMMINGPDGGPKNPSLPTSWANLPHQSLEWRASKGWLDDYRESEHRSLIPFGKAMGKNYQLEGTRLSVAMVDLGAAAYYSDWNLVDLFGLTHPKNALARAAGNYNPHMLLAERPDIVLLGEFYREPNYRGQFAFETELYNIMPDYGYKPVNRFIWNRVFGFLIFTKDDEVTQRLRRLLNDSPEIRPHLTNVSMVN